MPATAPHATPPTELEEGITIEMTETVSYLRVFTLAELASVLGTAPTRAAVQRALDPANLDYGTTDPDDESLLNALLPPGDTNRELADITARSWTVTWPARHRALPADSRSAGAE